MIDSRDFKLHKPEDVIKSVMNMASSRSMAKASS